MTELTKVLTAYANLDESLKKPNFQPTYTETDRLCRAPPIRPKIVSFFDELIKTYQYECNGNLDIITMYRKGCNEFKPKYIANILSEYYKLPNEAFTNEICNSGDIENVRAFLARNPIKFCSFNFCNDKLERYLKSIDELSPDRSKTKDDYDFEVFKLCCYYNNSKTDYKTLHSFGSVISPTLLQTCLKG